MKMKSLTFATSAFVLTLAGVASAHPVLGMPLRPGRPVLGLPVRPIGMVVPRPIGLPVRPIGIVVPRPIGLPVRPIGMVVPRPIGLPVRPIGMVIPPPVGLPVIVTSYQLNCNNLKGEANNISRVTLTAQSLNPREGSYSVSGNVLLTNGYQENFSDTARGYFKDGRADLEFSTVGQINLTYSQEENSYKGVVELLGNREYYTLFCSLIN